MAVLQHTPTDLSEKDQVENGPHIDTRQSRAAISNGVFPVNQSSHVEETASERIERLGRERPQCFANIWSEIAFCFSILMSQILTEYNVSGVNVILPKLIEDFHIPLSATVWPASALSLAVASTLLVFGRLSDMFGGYLVYVCGFLWTTIWSLILGFSQNMFMLIFCRALQGIGLAAFLPSGVMLLATIYRPGPRKNLVFSLYGACAVLGFFGGIFIAGICGEYLNWSWYFYIDAILCSVTTVSAYFSVPSDYAEKRKLGIKMDWIGACLVVIGLVLFVFAITDGSHAPQRWKTPYVYICLIIGAIILCIAVYIEGWAASSPLLPGDLFSVQYLKPVIIVLSLVYGGLGVFLLYSTLYMMNFMGASPLQVVAWSTPMAVGGMMLSTMGGLVLHLINGTILLFISGAGFVGSSLLFALAPEGANYWAFVFPAMICATIGIDITFNVVNIFITTNMPSERQGLAGALLNSVQHLGVAILLGFADVTQAETEPDAGLRKSYKAVFWYNVACTGLSCIVVALFIRIDRAKSDMTVDEKRELERAAMAASSGQTDREGQ